MKALQWQTAAAATAQLYFVSVCVCTVNILLQSRTGDLYVYTLGTFMSVYMAVLSVSWLGVACVQADVIVQPSAYNI